MNYRALQVNVFSVVWILLFFASFANAEQVKRSILVPYNGNQIKNISDTLVHRMAEMPLNFLGLKVTYWDLQKGLPSNHDMEDVKGILVWLDDDRISNPEEFISWLEQAIISGVRVGLFGNPALLKDYKNRQVASASANRLLKYLGVQSEGSYTSLNYDVLIDKKNDFITDFEYPSLGAIAGFERYITINGEVNSHLSLKIVSTSMVSHVVSSGPRGGFIESGFTHVATSNGTTLKWRINPFIYFRLAFATDDLPKPDPTTVSNRRVLFSYILGPQTIPSPLPKNFASSSSFWRLVNELAGSYTAIPMTIIVGNKDRSIGDKEFLALTQYFEKFPQVEFFHAQNVKHHVATNFGSLDTQFPFTYTSLPPFTRFESPDWQVYLSSNSDIRLGVISDMTLKNYMTRSETPYRVRPLGIYYSSSDKVHSAQLNALKKYFEKTKLQENAAVPFNLYSQMIEDFHTLKIIKLSEQRWEFQDLGELRSIRFDHASHLAVNFARSQGIIGQRHFQGSLYIALDKNVSRPTVQLTDITAQALQSPIYLIHSSWLIEKYSRKTGVNAQFHAHGIGPAEFVLHATQKKTYHIVASTEDSVIWEASIVADDNNQLRFTIDPNKRKRINIKIYPETTEQVSAYAH